MITYEFKCITCGNVFEKVMPLSDYKGHFDCPDCGSTGDRHFTVPPSIDTYFPGSYKDQNPVHGI